MLGINVCSVICWLVRPVFRMVIAVISSSITFMFLCTDCMRMEIIFLLRLFSFTCKLILTVLCERCHFVFCPHDVYFHLRCPSSSPSDMNVKVIVIHKSSSPVFEMSIDVWSLCGSRRSFLCLHGSSAVCFDVEGFAHTFELARPAWSSVYLDRQSVFSFIWLNVESFIAKHSQESIKSVNLCGWKYRSSANTEIWKPCFLKAVCFVTSASVCWIVKEDLLCP